MHQFDDIVKAAVWVKRNASGPVSVIARAFRFKVDTSATDGFPVKVTEQYIRLFGKEKVRHAHAA